MSLAQLSRLLPLPDTELQQVLDYAATLPKAEAAEHFRNLLGDSGDAVEFISTFNGRRKEPTKAAGDGDIEAVPKSTRAPKKKKLPLHTPAPRKVEDFGPTPGSAYKKVLEEDYITKKPTPPPQNAGSAKPPPNAEPSPSSGAQKQRPSAGYLISDPVPKAKSRSNPGSRSSTPKPAATKVAITGGTPMVGASAAIADLDAAIRALEISTNPTLADDVESRRCNCVATRHPLQAAAPNCLSCGKVICLKEGLGPCTSCGTPLLSAADVQDMIRELRADRGHEKMALDREAHKRVEVSKAPVPFAQRKAALAAAAAEEEQKKVAEAQAKALEHRDRLLGYQAQNARRTTVRDEAADFDVSGATGGGGNMWASPEERAQELKRQQKLLREMEWNARPEYEKRREVISIDLVGGRVVKKMAAVQRPASPDVGNDRADVAGKAALEEMSGNRQGGTGAGGAFSKNPLLGGLIKPVYDAKGKGTEAEGRAQRRTQWRRVQDDGDNEAVILDGGVHGYGPALGGDGGDEPACG